jgi:hypothetical protein
MMVNILFIEKRQGNLLRSRREVHEDTSPGLPDRAHGLGNSQDDEGNDS